MEETRVEFEEADLSYTIPDPEAVALWLIRAAQAEGEQIHFLSIVFCTDEYLLKVNQLHLNHDYYTDVITFDLSTDNVVEGEIYISIDRVKENAKARQTQFLEELHRVIIHGLLHLCGFSDKDPESKAQMTNKEDYYLSLRDFLSAKN